MFKLSSFKPVVCGRRLQSTLAFVEGSAGKISAASLSSLRAAQELKQPVSVVVTGSNSSAVVQELQKVDGLSKIFVAEDAKFDKHLPEVLSPLVRELIQAHGFTHAVAPANTVGKNFIPRLGALLDVQPVSDIVKVVDAKTFVRPIYAGNILQTVESQDPTVLITARPSAFEPVAQSGAFSYPVEQVSASGDAHNVEWVSESIASSTRPELSSAKRVVSGGRGLKNKENFDKLIFPLADAIGAGVGATRAAVDAGFVDNAAQVGQTGKVVAPELYVAVGISGAIQHLAGMKDSKQIVAINKDEEAPIFNVADYGLVGDLFEIVPELTDKLSKK